MQRLTKQYPSGTITLDAEQFGLAQETIEGMVNAEPVLKKVVEMLFEYENGRYGLITSVFRKRDIKAVPIWEMNLSVRSYNCLMRAGIRTLKDLSELTIEDLMKVRNLGQKSLKEIVDKCKQYGVEVTEALG